jgi:hypothetical protein
MGPALTAEQGEAKYAAGDRMAEIEQEIQRLTNERLATVPDAPFKKTWHELVLKRMLRWAAENGFDKIGWTTGEQQAERYDLSKHIDNVGWWRDVSGRYGFIAHKDGKMVTKTIEIPAEKLSDYIGKEMAQKILDGVGQSDAASKKYGPKIAGEISGLDLRVGGEGMKGFYDQMIPSFLNKYTKKWGGRVGTTKLKNASSFIPTRAYRGPEFTRAQIDAALEEYAKGRSYGSSAIKNTFTGGTIPGRDHRVALEQSLRSISRRMEQGVSFDQTMREYGSNEVARYMGGDMVEDAGQSRDVPVHSLDITPDMRKSVIEQGQSMFEKTLNLFGDEDMPTLARPKREDPNQPGLFSRVARPQFDVPAGAFRQDPPPRAARASQPALPDDSFHKVRMQEIKIPGAIRESAIVDRLIDTGFLKIDNHHVESPTDVAALFHFLKERTVENLYVVGLDAKGNVLGVRHAGQGLIDQVASDQRAVFAPMKMLGAKQVVLVHNHPSGSPNPSKDDISMTRAMRDAAKTFGMTVPYHVVIDGEKFGLILEGDIAQTVDAPPEPEGRARVPVVEPLQRGKATGESVTGPRSIDQMVKGLIKDDKTLVAFALNTQNQVAGVWVVPAGEPQAVIERLSHIVLRNNATSMILASRAPISTENLIKIRSGVSVSAGADIIDHVQVSKGGGFVSASATGRIKESLIPYRAGEAPEGYGDQPPEGVKPGQNAENVRAFNRKKIQVEILRAEVGIPEADWLKLKIELTGRNNLAEMTVPQLEKMAIELRARKRGTTSIPKPKDPNDPEATRKRLDIGDPTYKKIREKVLGPEVAGRKLNDEEKKTLVQALKAYPVDVRGHAIPYDIPGAHGIKIDPKFANEVGGYHDLTDYQRTFLETWRAMSLIDPSGHFKKLSFDKMEAAVEEEMGVVESIRRRMVPVIGDIKPGSPESARIMRYGEGRYGQQYIHEVLGRKFRNQRALDMDEWEGEPLTKEQRRILQDSVDRDIQEIKEAKAFDPSHVTERERNIDTYLRSLYDDLLDWQNEVRKKYGKPEIPKRKYYYTHVWEQNIFDTMLEGLQKDQSKTLPHADYTRPNAPFNPYEIARRGGTGYVQDAIGVFDLYLNTAAREALYRPVIAEIRQMVKYLPGRTAQAVDRWLNDMSGKTTFLDRANLVPQWIMRPALWMSRRAKGNLLVMNFNFMLTNSTNFATTVGDVGPRYTLAGSTRFAGSPAWRNFAWTHSSLLQSRTNIFELDYSHMNAAVKFMSGDFIEFFNVGSAFLGGYFKGKDAGMSEKEAVEYGDNVARRTQADYRKHAVSPFMRSRLGKVFGMMQTYPFNLWHTLQYDYLRAPAPLPRSEGNVKENLQLGRKTKNQKMGHLFALALGVGAANWMKERVSGRPAYDLKSWIPNIFWMPPWLILKMMGAGGRHQAREFYDPFYFRMFNAAGDAATAIRTGKDSDWKVAGKELAEIAFLIGPYYGGLQMKRFLLDHTILPTVDENHEAPAGARPVTARPASVRPVNVRPVAARRLAVR